MAQVRVQLSIDDDLLSRIDAFAKSAGLSRSAFLAVAALDYISAKEKVPEIAGIFAEMAASFEQFVRGEITQDEFQTKIDGFDDRTRRLNA